jgi:hypothetical protein
MASAVEDLPIHSKIHFNHCGLSNMWYNRHPPLSTSTCNVSLHLPKCPKAGIAASLVIHAFFCYTARLPQSRGQLVRHPQALIGKTSTSFFSFICTNADNTSLRIVRAVICSVSRHIEALPHSRGQHVRHPQAFIGETPRILTLCFSTISNQKCELSEQSTTAHQLDNPLHHWLEYPISEAYSTLDSSDKLAHRHILAPAHHHHERPRWPCHQENHTLKSFHEHNLYRGTRQGDMLGSPFYDDLRATYIARSDETESTVEKETTNALLIRFLRLVTTRTTTSPGTGLSSP